MKVALVHDYLTQYGGAERVLEVFSEIFPDAPIYTLIYNSKKLHRQTVFKQTNTVFSDKKVITSFLQKIPFAKSKHRIFPLLMPAAIEQFDFSGYDLVLSDSASFAKGIITKPECLHICYCHTPPRYVWDDSHKYIQEFGFSKFVKKLIPFFMSYIRIWDKEASLRVDKFICNSHFVSERIRKYYNKKALVIHPPVDIEMFYPSSTASGKNFLIVGRLLTYKRFDVAIKAFNKLNEPLTIVGDGPEMKRLKKMANSNIKFLGEVNDQELREHYQSCRALIFPQEEDFGIVALEAMACGKPVIAYRGGGALESIEENETGIFFDKQESESLIEAVAKFKTKNFDSKIIREQALKFSKQKFKEKIKSFIKEHYNDDYRN